MALENIYAESLGVPARQTEDGYSSIELLIGDVPPNGGPVDMPVGPNTTLKLFSVVGIGPGGGLALAKAGAEDDAPAAGTLTLSGTPADNDTVTIGSQVYRFKTAIAAENDVLIGASATTARNNLVEAVNGGAGSGVQYHADTEAHPDVIAQASAGNTMQLAAKSGGAAGNSIATTETGANTSFGAATLTGGGQGVIAMGVLMVPVSTGAGEQTTARIHTSGHFNGNRLTWDASFTTKAAKVAAFPPGRSNILIGFNPYDRVSA